MATRLELSIDQVKPGFLTPFGVDGFEAISTRYSFDVRCTAAGSPLLGADILGRTTTLSIDTGVDAVRSISGIVGSIKILPPTVSEEALYLVRIVPWVSRLELSRHNHVFGSQSPVSVADILQAELTGVARTGSLAADTDGAAFPYDLRLKQTYPNYSQTVQYEETNFAFVSRLAEHWGIFYFFEQVDGRDRVVFADDNIFVPPLDGGAGLAWQPWITGTHVSEPNRIFNLDVSYDPVPERVYLRDYNELLPHVPLVVSAEIDPAGRGHWVEYGANYRTPAEGALLATVRAQEQLCRRVRFTGRSTAAQLAPGRMFQLSGAPYSAWNQAYLIVSVRHRARTPHPSVATDPAEPAYANEFTAIPLSVQYRPERVTPRPRVDGLLNGRVENSQVQVHPELDSNGRYRVRMPVDMSDLPSGTASQWIRKAEPYGGPANGMHFPLPAGTDVVIGCVNGDPDRPIILGAVPSADSPSMVDSTNPQMSRVRTRSGMEMTFADAPVRPSGT